MMRNERLAKWFGLGRASWVTLPRVLVEAMPDEWQEKMAALLEEWDDAWDTSDMPTPEVVLNGASDDAWLHSYRYPDRAEIEAHRIKEEPVQRPVAIGERGRLGVRTQRKKEDGN